MVHASLATSVNDIFLNSSLVTPQNKAFKALLLKFTAMIVASSQSTGTSFGLIQPTSTICHTCSPKPCKRRNQTRLSTIHDNKRESRITFRKLIQSECTCSDTTCRRPSPLVLERIVKSLTILPHNATPTTRIYDRALIPLVGEFRPQLI